MTEERRLVNREDHLGAVASAARMFFQFHPCTVPSPGGVCEEEKRLHDALAALDEFDALPQPATEPALEPRTAAGRALLRILPGPDQHGNSIAWAQRISDIEAEAALAGSDRPALPPADPKLMS